MHRNSMLKAGTRSEQRLIAPGCKTFSTNPADLIFYCPQRSMGKRSPSTWHLEGDRFPIDRFQSGRPDLLWPATIDGETISYQVPRGVREQYGECPMLV